VPVGGSTLPGDPVHRSSPPPPPPGPEGRGHRCLLGAPVLGGLAGAGLLLEAKAEGVDDGLLDVEPLLRQQPQLLLLRPLQLRPPVCLQPLGGAAGPMGTFHGGPTYHSHAEGTGVLTLLRKAARCGGHGLHQTPADKKPMREGNGPSSGSVRPHGYRCPGHIPALDRRGGRAGPAAGVPLEDGEEAVVLLLLQVLDVLHLGPRGRGLSPPSPRVELGPPKAPAVGAVKSHLWVPNVQGTPLREEPVTQSGRVRANGEVEGIPSPCPGPLPLVAAVGGLVIQEVRPGLALLLRGRPLLPRTPE